ncbi:hypothetical protein GCM10022222_70080 [Amycolatopsis ultiminotia]|uniref:Cytochrome P450 n=1 Tax=Amycolatopsis ultiminotia TaxID=543629 RepID=A0ABP6Y0T0_9PSEU
MVAANHDPAQFPDPGNLATRRHLGFGPHQCVGEQLARPEPNAVLGTLPPRSPSRRLAMAFDEIEFNSGTPILGPARLPVTGDEIR